MRGSGIVMGQRPDCSRQFVPGGSPVQVECPRLRTFVPSTLASRGTLSFIATARASCPPAHAREGFNGEICLSAGLILHFQPVRLQDPFVCLFLYLSLCDSLS